MVRLFVAVLCCIYSVESRVVVQPDASRVKREAAPALPKVNTTERLGQLRALMQSSGVQAYIVPSVDAHMSGYVAPPFRRRQYISGFTGSSGDAVVTLKKAAMWTDGRYFSQALMQMDDNWELMRLGQPGTPTEAQWLKKELSAGNKVAIDPSLVSITDFEDLVKELAVANLTLVAVSPNMIDLIWKDRPPVSNKTIYPLGLKFAGQTWQDKVKELRDDMNAKQATAMVLIKLDEVAWVLNLRGGDVPSNPLFFAFVLITNTAVRVYVSDNKITEAVRIHLSVDSCSKICAELLPYKISKLMEDIRGEEAKSNAKIWLSPYSSYELKRTIPDDKLLLEDQPVALRKSIKNPTEIRGMKNAHLKDSVAIVEFFYWLKNEVPKGRKDLTEISASQKLEEFKSAQKDYVGQSFGTIAGYGPNGAIIHYRATPETDTQISDDNTFLVDTGSQYLDGTTDTTRTVHFGEPSAKQKEAYTRVMKGQIALALAVFPNNTQGRFLDPIARMELWRNGLDYRHGTGHGIGMFLSVHEGPQRISVGCPKPWEKPIAPGMFQSDEPGYYEDGSFGIRLENIVLAVPANTQNTFNDVQYLTFEEVAFVPYWKKLIDLDLLTPTEVNWLNNYHKQCREKVGPLLKEQGRSDVNDWLIEITEPISLEAKAGGSRLTMSGVALFLAAIGVFTFMQ